jgi:arsenate reductase (thioredoxin)
MAERARPLIYFLCVGNAMRSQMAEAFLRHYAGDRYEVASAGTHPLGVVLPEVVEVMREKGFDLSAHRSEPIDPEIVACCLKVIDLGGRGRGRIPRAYAERYVEWRVEDPYGMAQGSLRAIRDEIEARVLRFIQELDEENGTSG